jgi:hypothetical protein
VPTLTLRLLYCFFVIEHGRRRVLHFNVTRHPTADWVVQQLREAFPEAGPYRYAILDHDSKFDGDVIAFLKATGLSPKRTSVQAPWQNGIAERWVGSCRREILDHIIALNEQHLRRLIRDYVNYHQDDRIHDSLDKDTPNRRPVESKPSSAATVKIAIYYAVVLLFGNIAGEELWWRGYLLPRQEVASGRIAWLYHGLFWAGFHLFIQTTAWDLIRMMPTCCALAFVAQHRKNSWPGIFAHTVGNLGIMIGIVRGVIA